MRSRRTANYICPVSSSCFPTFIGSSTYRMSQVVSGSDFRGVATSYLNFLPNYFLLEGILGLGMQYGQAFSKPVVVMKALVSGQDPPSMPRLHVIIFRQIRKLIDSLPHTPDSSTLISQASTLHYLVSVLELFSHSICIDMEPTARTNPAPPKIFASVNPT